MGIGTFLTISIVNPLFKPGKITMTAGVDELIRAGRINIGMLLARHLSGDWGDLDEHDKAQNQRALHGSEDRLFSSYQVGDDLTVWIITEWDRSVTTALLPSEY